MRIVKEIGRLVEIRYCYGCCTGLQLVEILNYSYINIDYANEAMYKVCCKISKGEGGVELDSWSILTVQTIFTCISNTWRISA